MTAVAASESVPVVPAPGELVPLSHLALDLPEPPEGWSHFLGVRGVVVRPDSLGRNSITATAARRLLDEKREAELKRQQHLAVVEQEAVERDQAFRASLPKGLSWLDIPVGATYGDLVRQAELDGQPKRRSVMEDALSGQGTTFHSYQAPDEGS